MGPITNALLTFFLAWFSFRMVELYRFLHSVRQAPGIVTLLRPFSRLAQILRLIGGRELGVAQVWRTKFTEWEKLDCTVIFYKPILLWPHVGQCLIADPIAAKLVMSDVKFVKSPEEYKMISFFGANVVTTEGAMWRRHRRLTTPSFSQSNNALVWTETRRIIEECFEALSTKQDSQGFMEDLDTDQTALRIALMVISVAGFGKRSLWPRAGCKVEIPEDHKVTFGFAMGAISSGIVSKALVPNWAYKLPLKLQRPRYVKLCYEEPDSYIREMIEERRGSASTERDLFGALMEGVKDETGEGVLTTQEFMGNLFIVLFAGHETTAHTLAFTLTLLALHPECQQRIFEESASTFQGNESSYADFSHLKYTLAAIQETLRYFPVVSRLPRVAREDTPLPVQTDLRSASGPTTRDVFIPAGTKVSVSIIGIHHNPLYWKDPGVFDPSRFIDTDDCKWNRDAWIPFAAGPRACLGQRFALVELVAILSYICRHYEIHPAASEFEVYALREGETDAHRIQRVVELKFGLTLSPKDPLPLRFKKRAGR